jgi:hypothetical protein
MFSADAMIVVNHIIAIPETDAIEKKNWNPKCDCYTCIIDKERIIINGDKE